jgi:hypothetical protein
MSAIISMKSLLTIDVDICIGESHEHLLEKRKVHYSNLCDGGQAGWRVSLLRFVPTSIATHPHLNSTPSPAVTALHTHTHTRTNIDGGRTYYYASLATIPNRGNAPHPPRPPSSYLDIQLFCERTHDRLQHIVDADPDFDAERGDGQKKYRGRGGRHSSGATFPPTLPPI